MKKGIFCIVFSILMMIISPQLKAQFNLGGGLVFNRYSNGDFKKVYSGLQMRIGYDLPKKRLFFSAGYNITPTKWKSTTYLTDDPESYETLVIKMNNAFFHYGVRLFEPEGNFHVRLFGGASMDFINCSWEVGENVSASEKKTLTDTTMQGPKVDLGISLDFKFGNGMFFGEYVLGLPANKVNDQPFDNPTIFHRGMIIGYSYIFESKKTRW